MPRSISSVRTVPADNKGLASAVSQCNSLGELLEMVPAPYRPRMQDLVNRVYRAAIKSNHARSYLASLEKHLTENTFPPEIEGRVHPPSLQISKEYSASAESKTFEAERLTKTRAYKKDMLNSAINLKRAEVTYLQSQFTETTYSAELDLIWSEVTTTLSSDASVALGADGKVSTTSLPDWIRADSAFFLQHKKLFPQRSIALAYGVVQQEMSKKFKSLSLKRKTDEDVDMLDAPSKTESVDALVHKKVEQLFREYKISKPGMHSTHPAMQKLECTTDIPRKRKRSEDPKFQTQTQGESHLLREDSKGQEKHGKRKREWREETSRQVSGLERALAGFVPKAASAPPRSHLAIPLTTLNRKDRTIQSTPLACQFLTFHSDLFCGVSDSSRQQFVSSHTPVALFEIGHQFNNGIFKGPDVVIPRAIEYKLALNTKFILHHAPNPLRVFQAWPHLERSVRLRWHFRNTEDRQQSKFYVPKKDWMPPREEWNFWIEKGLQMGKDLLFERTSALPSSDTHKSNPDLRSINDFLQSSGLLLKITDKNLGVAAISKSWYLEGCTQMLEDSSTYERITLADIKEYYQPAALKRIHEIVDAGSFSAQTSEYLRMSEEDDAIPEFHAIPKIHKTPWRLRPIVPSHSWCTKRASEVCDFVLRAYHREHFPWVVDSTREVLATVNKHTIVRTDDTWIVTGDLESFYTNVNTKETIDLLLPILAPRGVLNGVDQSTIPHLLEVVMACNCFGFHENYFLQTNGVAMGTSCAPAFANVSLGFKEQFMEEIVKCNNEMVLGGLILYQRYIDDILLVFKGTKTDLQSCLDRIGLQLKPFKIDWKIHSTREPASFLDVEFFFEYGFGPVGMQSRVFRKRLNQHQYIPWSSAHPLSVKKAFIKAELTRYMIISSSKKLFEERVSEFMSALDRRGYPASILRIWKRQVNYDSRWESLSKRKDPSTRGLPLMLPSSYDEIWEYTDLHDVFNTMMNQWVKCGEPLPQSLTGPLIKSLKRTENLFDKISSWNKAILTHPLIVT